MTDFGPEEPAVAGFVTPEEALAHPETFVVVSAEELQARMDDPEIAARRQRCRQLLNSRVDFITGTAQPGIFVIDHNLGRRARMHAVEDDE